MRLWTPAYGKRMLAERQAGRHPPGTVLISMGLWLGRTWPPNCLIVIPDEAPIGRLDLRCIAGLFCELVLATEPLPASPTREQLAAVRKQRLRAQELVNVSFASPIEADVHTMVDVRAQEWAMAVPRRKPLWYPANDEQIDHWRRCGVWWSEQLCRREAA